MANLMALTVARDVHLAKLLGGLPRGTGLEGSRVTSDQTHFSVERAVDLLGFPEGTLRSSRPIPISDCRPQRSSPRSSRTAPPA